jgi:hypothetical protein
MGCCGEKNTKYSTMEFYVELFNLEPDVNNKYRFTIKKLESQKFDKVIEKTLREHLANSKIMKNKYLDERFQFNINNALFYCYLNDNPIIKNYLQVKDLETFNFDTLYKISILLTKNYDQLNIPKINLINKTKFVSDLDNFVLDFSNVKIDTNKIFDPNISSDDLVLTKPHLTEDLSEIHEEENENNSNEQIDERESEYNNESEDNSVYDDEGEEDIIENDIHNQHENVKNYIHIKGEITPELVRSVFQKLSPYIEEGEEEDDEGKDKNETPNNKEIIRKFRKNKSNIISGLDGKKGKSDISIVDDNILAKKGKEIALKLDSFKDSEQEQKEDANKEKEQDNKIIDSVFIEGIKNIDLEIFSELIEILSIYPHLKRLSFCDFNIDKEFEGWENIIHLINENSKIRWLDFHKSNMNNYILEKISKVIENKRIRYLDISENFINEDGSKILGEFLSKNKTLQRLMLSNNDLEHFKKTGVGYICKPLALHPNIQLVDFCSMTVTGCGEYVANLIKSTKSIKTILLRDCLLNLKDFQNICRALSLENISKTIINVDFSHNDMASDKSLEEIGKMIKVNKTLHTLNMEKMNLTMENYNLIFNGLNENETITDFSFCYNPNIKPRIVLEYFLHRKKLSALAYIPYKAGINEKGPKVEFNLDERKLIEKFKKKRKKVKLITR